MAHHTIDITKENRLLGSKANGIIIPALAIGVIGIAVTAGLGFTSEGGMDRFMQGWLVAFMFFLAISLGGLFFTLLHHATHAAWSVTIRRASEAMAANLPWMAIIFLPLLWAAYKPEIDLFGWADPELVNENNHEKFNALIAHKSTYLNMPFFIVRAGIYFAIWSILARFFYNTSVKQDSNDDVRLAHRMMSVSYPGLILFALTITFAAFDWLMSQDANWFSTIWGVYYFAGIVSSFMAMAIIFFMLVQKKGMIINAVSKEHYHDLGKLLFAFGIVFWAYIAFSQYMLQWYGNMPEETMWWQARASSLSATSAQAADFEHAPGAWNNWSTFLLLGHFAVPFIAFISRWPKRIMPLLAITAVWMLFMGWYDLYWLVMPVFYPEGIMESALGLKGIIMDIAAVFGIGGLWMALLVNRLRNVSLVAEQDPRLSESLAFENF